MSITSIKLKKAPPRWLQLYNYSKTINKTKELKTLNQSHLTLQREQSECTFHPITHYTRNNHNRNNTEITNSFLERTRTWSNNKMRKIHNMQRKKITEEHMKYQYRPNIERDINYFTTVGKTTEEIVMDPESYNLYIQQRKNYLQKEEDIKIKNNLKPGNGNIWKPKLTKFKEFSFCSSIKKSKSGKLLTRKEESYDKKCLPNYTNLYMVYNTHSNNNNNNNHYINNCNLNDVKQKLHLQLHEMKI
jgi:hypothetical protein